MSVKIRIEHSTKEESEIDLPRELSEKEFEKLKDNAINLNNGYEGKFTKVNNKKNIGKTNECIRIIRVEIIIVGKRVTIVFILFFLDHSMVTNHNPIFEKMAIIALR